MGVVLSIFVPGRPAPQGSKVRGRGGSFYEASKYLTGWRERVIEEAKHAVRNNPEWDAMQEAVGVVVTFQIERPKSHYVNNDRTQNLREGMPFYVNGPPDIDKLSRAVLDGLTQSGAILDDRRVVQLIAAKNYAPTGGAGAFIVINPIMLNGIQA